MFNPLLSDLTQLKDTELENKISDLNKKYSIALRMGNGDVANQIATTLESFRMETQRRQYEANKRMMEKQDKGLDGLINVG
jgi:hypothetical protein